MFLLRRWGPPLPLEASYIPRISKVSYRKLSGADIGQKGAHRASQSGGAPHRISRGAPSFYLESATLVHRCSAAAEDDQAGPFLSFEALESEPPSGPHELGVPGSVKARFPRPDIDLEALKAEEQRVKEVQEWQVVTTREIGPRGNSTWRRTRWPSASVDEFPDSGSPGENLEKLRADRRMEGPPSFCIYDNLREGDLLGPQGQVQGYGGIRATQEEGKEPLLDRPSAGLTLYSEGPSDWRLDLNEELDADWARLSGGPWGSESGGPFADPRNRLQDKRLRVFVPRLGCPKPIALLNRFQLLQSLEEPLGALGVATGDSSPQPREAPQALNVFKRDSGPLEDPSIAILPPEVYEALVERAIHISPSFNLQQLLQLVQLQQQHVHALQQHQQLLLSQARILRLEADAAASHQQQQHQQQLEAKATKAEIAAAAAAKSLKTLQQQQLFDKLFDELLPHLPVSLLINQ